MSVPANAPCLITWFSQHFPEESGARCLVAFSGGVDSAVLAKAATEALGDRAEAIFLRSLSMKPDALGDVQAVAHEIGIALTVLEAEEFSDPAYIANDLERCYYCKRVRMRQLSDYARENGCEIVVEGSNADDSNDFRPGARAVAEAGGRSPLAELGLRKADVRELARYWNLSIHAKPSESCLSTRLEYGLELTPERLVRIGRAEKYLSTLGFEPLRVRMHADDHIRIEVGADRIDEIVCYKAPILSRMHELGFRLVAVDLEGYRTGKMNPVDS